MPAPRLAAGRWSPDVRIGLERMLSDAGELEPGASRAAPPLAALDFDDTCLDGDISHAVLEELEREIPGLVDAYRRACAVDLRAGWVGLVGTLCGGRSEAEVAALTARGFERGLADGAIRLVPEMQDLVGALHEAGWEVWVVTASATPVVRGVCPRYGIAPERILGMNPGVGADGRYTAEVTEPVTFREGKLLALRARTGRDPDFAAGDSPSDLALLRAARRVLLVDRGDPAMRDEARARGWWIQGGWR